MGYGIWRLVASQFIKRSYGVPIIEEYRYRIIERRLLCSDNVSFRGDTRNNVRTNERIYIYTYARVGHIFEPYLRVISHRLK